MPPDSTPLLTRYGQLQVPSAPDDIIVKFLTRTGEWGWDEVSFVAGCVGKNPRLLDVGAFLGTFSLGFAQRNAPDFVCLVEANPHMVPLLRENVARNLAAPSAVVEALVGAPDGEHRRGYMDAQNMGSVSFATDVNKGAKDVVIGPQERTVTIAELREKHGDFDIIKIDVEGMEHEVLLGDAEYLAQGSTTLWVECNEDPRSLDVLDLVLKWNLSVHYFAFPSHNPDNFRNEVEPVFPWAYEAGLLIAPRRTPALDATLAAHGCILRTVSNRAELEEALWLTPRWLPAKLAHANVVELAAVAGRALRGQVRESFLQPGAAAAPSSAELPSPERARLAAAEAALRRAEEIAFARQEELEGERARREEATTALRRAEEIVFARQEELAGERARREEATTALRRAEQIVFARQEEVESERARREEATAALRRAEEIAFARLEEVERERVRREEAVSALRQAEDAASARRQEAESERALRDEAVAALRRAEQIALARQEEIESERRLRESAELRLANATAVMLARLREVGLERERRQAAEMSVEERARGLLAQEAALARAQRQIDTMRSTVVWRLASPVQHFIGSHPSLHAAARAVRRAGGRVYRRVRNVVRRP